MNNYKFNSGLFLFAAVLLSILIRFYDISERPLHNDEAVNSIKLKYLLENGNFEYDPIEYHGPSLYYFSVLGIWLTGNTELKNINEIHLRAVPIVFSLLLFLFLYLVKNHISSLTIIMASVFLILSPFLNFYSRYFIHEQLFTTLSFLLIAAIFLFNYSKKFSWLILIGILAGLLFATKETSVIVFFSIFISILLTKTYKGIKPKYFLLSILPFLIITIFLYSSFFTNIKGIADSVLTYKYYLVKSSANLDHIYPWYYYLSLFTYNNFNSTIITELIIILLAIYGIVFSFKDTAKNKEQNIFKFISIFTISFTMVVSLLDYKTPWNILTAWTGTVLLSGYGFSVLYELLNKMYLKIIFFIIVSLGSVHLLYQTFLTSFYDSSSPNNPYTYSQPTKEIFLLTDELNKIINYDQKLKICIIADNNQYWPLPWYLRKAENTAWHSAPSDDLYTFDVIISEPKYLDKITDILFNLPEQGKIDLYVPIIKKDIQIRPGKYFTCYIKNDIYLEYLYNEN